MASPTKRVLEGFMALHDNASRRAVINGIIDSLSSHEIREVKSRFESMTFQCDFLDKLPLELVAMLAEYMELTDLILLRRVSKRWHELLSSTIVTTTAIKYHMGKNVIKSDSPADLDVLIKKRIRAERGLPAVVVTIPNNLSRDSENDLNRDSIGCFNGVCAWIEESTDRTTIFLVHLPTGKNRTLTTENREELNHVEVSDTLVSATSVRGYCHVWSMSTEQYKSFRIPSLQFGHYISIGSKVVLGYVDSVVHFCFDSGVARSIKLGPFILLLSVHAEEDALTVVSVRRKHSDNIQPWEHGALYCDEHHLKTQKFSVYENKFISTWEQYRELPFRMEELCELQCEPEDMTPYRESLRPGQSSALLVSCMTVPYINSLSLSLEADDQITVHFHSAELDFKNQHANLDYSARGPGLTYCFEEYEISMKMKLCIGYESLEPAHVFDAKGRQFESRHTIDFPKNRLCTSVLGDGDFVIFPSDDKIWIWCFDETWLPSGVPDMRIATW
ncbi:hypothetical protein N7517_005821 [Penicillium concentricum]|uniref:F-box domain-containing protein n=1 Tax=Penicillium concentricum TaxID=293559 RepID=A0A9W9S9B8_9EURO|nr:uncharacterized protein N7517_005821 [Penicillium concentricum]KAJ5373815.1 hypothetical protein N7517_005821 [Penicillium concentricum]